MVASTGIQVLGLPSKCTGRTARQGQEAAIVSRHPEGQATITVDTTRHTDNYACCLDKYTSGSRSALCITIVSFPCVAHHRGQHRNRHAQFCHDSSQGCARSNSFGVHVPRETRGCDKKRPRNPHSHGAGMVPRESCTAVERFHPLANRIPCARGAWHGCTRTQVQVFGQRKDEKQTTKG